MNIVVNKSVVLFSGGIDSSATLLFLLRKNFDVYPVFVDFGQPSAKMEWEACKKIAGYLSVENLKKVNLNDIASIGIRGKNESIDHKYAFLAIVAGIYAASKEIDIISAGLTKNSKDFPDTGEMLLNSLQKLLMGSIGYKVFFFNPFLGMTKDKIILYSVVNGLPTQYAYSCYKGGKLHCGMCKGCKSRKSGFRRVNMRDNIKYYGSK